MTTYGHRQLSLFFFKLLDVSDDGFSYKGKTYGWNDIESVDVQRGSFALNALMFPAGTPRAKVTLADGKVIQINGRALERADRKSRIDKLSGESDAFIEFLTLLEGSTKS